MIRRRSEQTGEDGRSDLDGLALRVRALFEVDSRGRLMGRRDGAPPPRFYLGRTPHGNTWRFGQDCRDVSVVTLARYASKEGRLDLRSDAWPPPPPERHRPLAAALEASAPIRSRWRGPLYRFGTSSEALCDEPVSAAAPVVRALDHADPSERGRVAAVLGASKRLSSPCFAGFDGENLIAFCHCACGLPGAAFEAGVWTQSDARGRSAGARCLALWARELRASGAEPFYSATWEDRTARELAERLGLECFADELLLG